VPAGPKVKSSQASYLAWLCGTKLVKKDASADEGENSGVFNGTSVLISREVPFVPLFLSLRSSGAAKVLAEALGDTLVEEVTHVIVDRPASAVKMTPNSEYI
jgi:hypothetical protein